MVGLIGGRGSAFDYIGPNLPNNPQNGEMWFDTDAGSDGSGEVKVYDGANGAWEATGFTSHADLTDVTRSAHHPPVDVSDPLLQPSDQSLGLSVGDGLTTASGALVAALGSGLGVDANGNVYIPASAVSANMLGFDPATQTELNGHAGNAGAHHSRYTDTEARSATDGNIDAETVDNQHASDLASTYDTETFSVSLNKNSTTVTTHNLSKPYKGGMASVHITPGSLSSSYVVESGVSSLNTNADGHIVSVDVEWHNGPTNSAEGTVVWNGEVA